MLVVPVVLKDDVLLLPPALLDTLVVPALLKDDVLVLPPEMVDDSVLLVLLPVEDDDVDPLCGPTV
ncbi:uncharacterized protein HMPREF1120_04546 [Exophiala dermatitidis NIH/UT8656]|uniref:Uncharacterized protein n=1 Tax=Exophiala dermatitidis (strain ATCC 34100 / CBS 525.76 / NIH/UT8656) TaxID=858893 RepID=H6C0U0_EXODN|nr:uncharacterized protein HMPREF1120_04546 [Exophiala dermatitidis NIH/UT8656]EHY56464.1 hypothetical protein HMPREF1120_04546 [Exophiala dermatitidis NIH/UT8656]